MLSEQARKVVKDKLKALQASFLWLPQWLAALRYSRRPCAAIPLATGGIALCVRLALIRHAMCMRRASCRATSRSSRLREHFPTWAGVAFQSATAIASAAVVNIQWRHKSLCESCRILQSELPEVGEHMRDVRCCDLGS